MNTLMQRQGSPHMTSYTDIADAMVSFSEAKERYWSTLEQHVSTITQGFADYLGKAGQTTRFNGEQLSYVTLGSSIHAGHFTPVTSPAQLDGADKTLNFTLRVIVEVSPEHHYKVAILQDVAMMQEQGKLRFVLEGALDKLVVEVPDAFNERHQAQLYEALAQAIKGKFDASLFE